MGVCYKRPRSQFERVFEWCGWSPGSLSRVRRSDLRQELLKMCKWCGFRIRDGEAMLVLYFVFRGKGQTLILIYHADVFSSGMWYDGLFGRWSGGSLISDGLLADA